MASAANASAHGPLGSDDASQAAPRGSRNLIDWKAVDIAAAKDALFQRTINDGIYHIHSHAESAKKSGSLTDKNFEAGCRQAQQDLGSGDYHIYIDYTRFAYNIILTRPERSSANIHTIKLKLYESNAMRPAHYAVVASWSDRDTQSAYRTQILTPKGTSFDRAFATFRHFFRKVTNVHWDYRAWNNALPYNMACKCAAREEGERVEDLTGEYSLKRCREISEDFLDRSPIKRRCVDRDSSPISQCSIDLLKNFCYGVSETPQNLAQQTQTPPPPTGYTQVRASPDSTNVITSYNGSPVQPALLHSQLTQTSTAQVYSVTNGAKPNTWQNVTAEQYSSMQQVPGGLAGLHIPYYKQYNTPVSKLQHLSGAAASAIHQQRWPSSHLPSSQSQQYQGQIYSPPTTQSHTHPNSPRPSTDTLHNSNGTHGPNLNKSALNSSLGAHSPSLKPSTLNNLAGAHSPSLNNSTLNNSMRTHSPVPTPSLPNRATQSPQPAPQARNGYNQYQKAAPIASSMLREQRSAASNAASRSQSPQADDLPAKEMFYEYRLPDWNRGEIFGAVGLLRKCYDWFSRPQCRPERCGGGPRVRKNPIDG